MRVKTILTTEQILQMKELHKYGCKIVDIRRAFRIRTQRVIQICGRRAAEYDSKYNETWG